MRVPEDKVSFISADKLIKPRKLFLIGNKVGTFRHVIPFSNLILSYFLKVTSGEIFILESDTTINIKSLLEKFKNKSLIKNYGEGALFSDYPKFNYLGIFYYVSNKVDKNLQTSWGYCFPYEDKELAFSKALGECLERHASYFIINKNNINYPRLYKSDATFIYKFIPKFSLEQLKENSRLVSTELDLKKIVGFKARSLTGDKSRFLPLEAFYWGSLADENQKIFFNSTTSGSGGGFTLEQATLSALNELIERDHFLLYWFSGIKPKRISNNTISGELGEYVRECEEKYKLEIYFLNLKYDIDILTCACVVIDPVLNRITVGAKTGSDGTEVLKGALLEALAVLSTTREKNKRFSEQKLRELISAERPFVSSISRQERIVLYSSEIGIKTIRCNFLGGKEQSFDDFTGILKDKSSILGTSEYIIEELKKLVKIKDAGYHAYIHNFSSKWLSEAKYHAVHVFIPSFLKLHLTENQATPISDRLIEFAKYNGKEIKDIKDLNTLPHFFS